MTIPAASLDDLGRCCGREPVDFNEFYALGGPHKFCPRCDRLFDRETGRQIHNWAWKSDDGGETFTDKRHSTENTETPK